MKKPKQKRGKQVQKQKQSVVVNVSKPRRSAGGTTTTRYVPYMPFPPSTPLPPRIIYINPPSVQAPKILKNVATETEYPEPLPLAPRVPIGVRTNLADTEHEIEPLGGVDRQAELFQEAIVGDQQQVAARDLGELGKKAKRQQAASELAARDLEELGKKAKRQQAASEEADVTFTFTGEKTPTAAAEEQVSELEKPVKVKEPRQPEPEWYAPIRKDFWELNRKQLVEDKKTMSEAAAKTKASERSAVFRSRGELGTFTVEIPEAIRAAPKFVWR